MHCIINLFIFILCVVVGSGDAQEILSCSRTRDTIPLKNINTLFLSKYEFTTGTRDKRPIRQIHTSFSPLEKKFHRLPTEMVCKNQGIDDMDGVVWLCTVKKNGVQQTLNGVSVSCIGCGDGRVLRGSCAATVDLPPIVEYDFGVLYLGCFIVGGLIIIATIACIIINFGHINGHNSPHYVREHYHYDNGYVPSAPPPPPLSPVHHHHHHHDNSFTTITTTTTPSHVIRKTSKNDHDQCQQNTKEQHYSRTTLR